MRYIDNESALRMVQVAPYRWEIQTRHGYVVCGDLYFSNVDEATTHIRAYLSSYLCWNFTVEPMAKDKK